MYSDDDANSDASSACSERSYSSRNGSIPTYMRQAEDVAEVLNRCASANWSERKEGLMGLQTLLKNQRALRYIPKSLTDCLGCVSSSVVVPRPRNESDHIHMSKMDFMNMCLCLCFKLRFD